MKFYFNTMLGLIGRDKYLKFSLLPEIEIYTYDRKLVQLSIQLWFWEATWVDVTNSQDNQNNP